MNGIFSRTAASAAVAILLAGGAAHAQQSVPAPMATTADAAVRLKIPFMQFPRNNGTELPLSLHVVLRTARA